MPIFQIWKSKIIKRGQDCDAVAHFIYFLFLIFCKSFKIVCLTFLLESEADYLYYMNC